MRAAAVQLNSNENKERNLASADEQTRAIFGIEPPPRVAGDGSVLNPTSAAPLIWDGRRLLASLTRLGKTLRTKPRAFTAS